VKNEDYDDNDDQNNNNNNINNNNNNEDDPHPPLPSSDQNKKKVSTSSYYKFSTILAIIITIPGIIVLFVLRYYDVDIIYQIIFSSLAFFICIGLSFKISSKLTKYYKN
jgi:putative Mn2+ efflux pump MntP